MDFIQNKMEDKMEDKLVEIMGLCIHYHHLQLQEENYQRNTNPYLNDILIECINRDGVVFQNQLEKVKGLLK